MTTTPETAIDLALNCHVTTYEVGLFPLDHEGSSVYNLRVEYRGKDLWGVFRSKWCLGSDGEWDWEPVPSDRDDEWAAAHRFGLDTALKLARQHAPGVTMNGKTAVEAAREEGLMP